MATLFLVNDAGSFETIFEPQDVTFYKTPEDAANRFEEWFVDCPYLALRSDGKRMQFRREPLGQLALTEHDDGADYSSMFRHFISVQLTHSFLAFGVEEEYRLDLTSLDDHNLISLARILFVPLLSDRGHFRRMLRWFLPPRTPLDP